MAKIHIDTDVVWAGAVHDDTAETEARSAKAALVHADEGDFGEFAKTAEATASFLTGVAGSVAAVAGDLANRTRGCVGEYLRTDQDSAGTFPKSR